MKQSYLQWIKVFDIWVSYVKCPKCPLSWSLQSSILDTSHHLFQVLFWNAGSKVLCNEFNSSRVEGWHLSTYAIAWEQKEKSRRDKLAE